MVDGNELAEMSCVFDHIGAAALTPEQTTGLLRGALTVTWSDPT